MMGAIANGNAIHSLRKEEREVRVKREALAARERKVVLHREVSLIWG
jgi:translation initiation factor 2 gamma subunit (eIF-2gamma)